MNHGKMFSVSEIDLGCSDSHNVASSYMQERMCTKGFNFWIGVKRTNGIYYFVPEYIFLAFYCVKH